MNELDESGRLTFAQDGALSLTDPGGLALDDSDCPRDLDAEIRTAERWILCCQAVWVLLFLYLTYIFLVVGGVV